MSKDICPECGRDRNMVGRAHRCVPLPGWAPPGLAATETVEFPDTRPEPKEVAATPRSPRKPSKESWTKRADGPIAEPAVRKIPDTALSVAVRQPTREGKKVVTAYLEPEQVKRLRVLAAEAGISMEVQVGTLIDAAWAEARKK